MLHSRHFYRNVKKMEWTLEMKKQIAQLLIERTFSFQTLKYGFARIWITRWGGCAGIGSGEWEKWVGLMLIEPEEKVNCNVCRILIEYALGTQGKPAVTILSCILARQLCFEDPSCSSILEIIPRVCGPVPGI